MAQQKHGKQIRFLKGMEPTDIDVKKPQKRENLAVN
jgi:hypothetical protein